MKNNNTNHDSKKENLFQRMIRSWWKDVTEYAESCNSIMTGR